MDKDKKTEVQVMISENTLGIISEAAQERKVETGDMLSLIIEEWAMRKICMDNGMKKDR